MKRLVVITVGKTHSGKTTFAKELEKQLPNTVVIDQDNHAEFINTFYKNLLPKQGPNTLKTAVSQTILDYAIKHTNYHIVLSNSNRNKKDRSNLFAQFHDKGFTSIIVYFNIPNHILHERIAKSDRSTVIFRSATTFEEVLSRQLAETEDEDLNAPSGEEADHMLTIKESSEVPVIMEKIIDIERRLTKDI